MSISLERLCIQRARGTLCSITLWGKEFIGGNVNFNKDRQIPVWQELWGRVQAQVVEERSLRDFSNPQYTPAVRLPLISMWRGGLSFEKEIHNLENVA